MKYIKLFESDIWDPEAEAEESTFSKILNSIALTMGNTIEEEFEKAGLVYHNKGWGIWKGELDLITELEPGENSNLSDPVRFFGLNFPDKYTTEECGEWEIVYILHTDNYDDERVKTVHRELNFNRNLLTSVSRTTGDYANYVIHYPVSKYFEETNQIFKEINEKLGRRNKKWTTREVIQDEANKYQARNKFREGSNGAYMKATKLGILDEVCSHMIQGNKPNNYWTEEKLREEALKYQTRNEFRKSSGGAYMKARQLGILDEVCSHMIVVGNLYKRGIYIIKFPALKACYVGLTGNYNKRESQYLSKNSGDNKNVLKLFKNGEDYEFDRKNDWYNNEDAQKKEKEWVDIMRNKGWKILNISKTGALGGGIRWTEEKLRKEALKYQTRNEFRKGSGGAYGSARDQGILDSVCSHMPKPVRWAKEKIQEEALKYQTRNEFAQGSGGAYNKAIRLGILDDVCSHMELSYKKHTPNN